LPRPARPHLEELPYFPDGSWHFAKVHGLPGAVFLDSCANSCADNAAGHFATGRYDLISASPRLWLTTRGGQTRIDSSEGSTRLSNEDPLRLLSELVAERPPLESPLPFCGGGAVACLSYDLGHALATFPRSSPPKPDLQKLGPRKSTPRPGIQAGAVAGRQAAPPQDARPPAMVAGLYEWGVVQDHERRRCWYFARPELSSAARNHWLKLFQQGPAMPASPLELCSPFAADQPPQTYLQGFAQAMEHIRAGDCYQINLARRFSAACKGDPWDAYRRLRRFHPAPHAGFMRMGDDRALLSLSPECLLKVRGRQAETRPIKGTRSRGGSPEQDRQLRQALLASTKDRSENLMIVDLLRNDLGRSCIPGSVQVSKLFAVESLANVHHLVSVIQGRLPPQCPPLQLLQDCFPGGSITGAPKLKAMEIIARLEPVPRSFYCGSLAYVGHDGQLDANILIRSLVHHQGKLHCWGGGGIVADSQAEEEAAEIQAKVAPLLDGLGTAASFRS